MLCPKVVENPDPEVWGGNLQEAILAEDQPDGIVNPDAVPGIPQYSRNMNWINCGTTADIVIPGNSWILFYIGDDHGLVPGSRGISFTKMLEGLQRVNMNISSESKLSRNGELLVGEGYEVLSALEVAVVASLIYTKTGQRILPKKPLSTYSLTRYYAVGYNRTIVGDNNDHSGLFGCGCIRGAQSIGVCAARRVSNHLRE